MNNKISMLPTRKAFQELTGIKDRKECATVLCIEADESRWVNCKNILAFSHVCLSGEDSIGSTICMSPDTKARWTNLYAAQVVNFILSKNTDIDSFDKINKALRCLIELHKDTDVIFFEKTKEFNNGLKFRDFVKFVKSHLPSNITAVFSLPQTKAKDLSDCFDVVVSLTDKQAFVYTSKTLMTDFNFTLKV